MAAPKKGDPIAEILARARDFARNDDALASVVEKLEEHLGDERALAFVLDLVTDPEANDLARIDALKLLQLWTPSDPATGAEVGRRLADALPAEPDIVVQQWLALAAGNFMSVTPTFDAVVGLMTAATTNAEVRHNCLAALKRAGSSKAARRALEPLRRDRELGSAVQRVLDAWGRPKPRL